MSPSPSTIDVKLSVTTQRIGHDEFYVACARDGIWLEPHVVTMHQLKAVTAALVKSFSPSPSSNAIYDIDGGDMILPIMDGPWAGHYLSWNPALGREKHMLYPQPHGSHFIVGYDNGRHCWWTK